METLIDNQQVVANPQGASRRQRDQLKQMQVVWHDGGLWSTSRLRDFSLSGTSTESTETLPEQVLLPLPQTSAADNRSQVDRPPNRRLHRRVQTPGSPYISHPDGNARIKELSVSGAYVMDIRPLYVGDEFRFSLHAGAENIRLEGVVVRSDPGRGMAIRFRDISSDAERSLRRYIARLNSPLVENTERGLSEASLS